MLDAVGDEECAREPINWTRWIGETTLYFKVLEELFAHLGEKRVSVWNGLSCRADDRIPIC